MQVLCLPVFLPNMQVLCFLDCLHMRSVGRELKKWLSGVGINLGLRRKRGSSGTEPEQRLVKEGEVRVEGGEWKESEGRGAGERSGLLQDFHVSHTRIRPPGVSKEG